MSFAIEIFPTIIISKPINFAISGASELPFSVDPVNIEIFTVFKNPRHLSNHIFSIQIPYYFRLMEDALKFYEDNKGADDDVFISNQPFSFFSTAVSAHGKSVHCLILFYYF
ncbi:MAG: hypothetical protein R2824_22850 [Saprospiraceae bacterium]